MLLTTFPDIPASGDDCHIFTLTTFKFNRLFNNPNKKKTLSLANAFNNLIIS